MPEVCSSCGAELFAGQQFCRRCGAPTRQFSTAEIPTQILPEHLGGPAQDATSSQARPTDTTPLGGARPTGDAYESRFAGYRPPAPHAGAHPTAPPQYPQPHGGSPRRAWLWALLAVLVASVAISALIARQFAVHWAEKKKAQAPRVVKVNVPQVEIPDIPLPPPLVLRAEEAGEPLDEEGGSQSSTSRATSRSRAGTSRRPR
jgi:hypothetical protein